MCIKLEYFCLYRNQRKQGTAQLNQKDVMSSNTQTLHSMLREPLKQILLCYHDIW